MDKIAISILNLLIFPETFQSIVDECPIPTTKYITADILKQLLHDELIIPIDEDEKGNFKRSLVYDSDNMDRYRYQITSKGLKIIS